VTPFPSDRTFSSFTFPVEQVTTAKNISGYCPFNRNRSPLPLDRTFSSFTFPVEQVQTVYRLLARAEPTALERLCMAITVGGIDDRWDQRWNS
jgi:hypothetical protein